MLRNWSQMSKSRQPDARIFFFVAKVCAIIIPLIFISCNDKDDLGPAPVIRSFGPSSGIIGTHVTIRGDQFIPAFSPDSSRQPNTSIITFNGTTAVAEYVHQDSIGKQRINTMVPIGATSGKITATANGITVSSADDFIITVPTYLPNVTVSTVADYGGIDVAIDSKGNLYIANNDLFEIVKIIPDGTRTTLLSTRNDTNRGAPLGITVDTDGNVYATVGNTIRKIFPDGTVMVLAGSVSADFGYADGQGAEARFSIPFGITVDDSGTVYVADLLNYKIRKISPDGTVSTLAGSTSGFTDGQGTSAQFGFPFDVALDGVGNIYVTDGKIRKVTSNGLVTTVAGSTSGYLDGSIANAQFNGPRGIIFDPAGNLYICDSGNFVVRRIAPDGTVVTVAGTTFGNIDGPGSSAKFGQTLGLAMDATGAFYLTQGGGLCCIRKIVIN